MESCERLWTSGESNPKLLEQGRIDPLKLESQRFAGSGNPATPSTAASEGRGRVRGSRGTIGMATLSGGF